MQRPSTQLAMRGAGIAATIIAGLVSLAGLSADAAPVAETRLDELAATVDSLIDVAVFARAESLAAVGLQLARVEHGPQTATSAAWLARSGRVQLELRRFDEAGELLAAALELQQASHQAGIEPAILTSRRLLFRLNFERGSSELDLILALADSCLTLSREIFGPDDARTAGDLRRRASVIVQQLPDSAAATRSQLDQAAQLVEEQWGADHVELGRIQLVRGILHQDGGDLSEVRTLFANSVEILERHHGADHPRITTALMGLAETCQRQGDLATAESLFRRCLAIRERTYGPDHPWLANIFNDLGVVLRRRGDYAGAVTAYRRALAIKTGSAGEINADVALTMVNLAAPLEAMGEHVEAKQLLMQAVEIFETVHGANHRLTAWALSHLGQMERQGGSHVEGEALFRRCAEIAINLYGPDHIDVVLYQVGIAQCLIDQGQLEKARDVLEPAMATAGQLLGTDNHEVARYRTLFGIVQLLLGDTTAARATLEQCLAILETQLGPRHPALIRGLSGLTVVSLAEGKITEARQHADRRLAVVRHRLGERGLRGSLPMKLAVEVAAADWEAAAAHGIHAAEITLDIQDDAFQVSSEREALRYAVYHRRAIGALLAAMRAAPAVPDSVVARIFTLVARGHGQVVDRLAQRRQFLELAADSSVTGELYATYRSAAEQLATQVIRGPRGKPEQFQSTVAGIRRDKESAERRLASVSERFRQQTEAWTMARELSPARLAAAMEPGATLLHFVHLPRFTIGTPDWRPGATSTVECLFSGSSGSYGVFALHLDQHGGWDLSFTDLGEAAQIDAAVAGYRQAIEDVGAGGRPSARQEAIFRTAAQQLHELIWAPCMAAAADNQGGGDIAPADPPLVLVVPTAQLQLVDFNTLLSPIGDLVIERWRVDLLSSARDLLRFRNAPRTAEGRGLLAVGNPTATTGAGLCADAQQSRDPLPGAENEVEQISWLFTQTHGTATTLLVGPAATERAVKQALSGRRVVHLATHGFFCADEDEPRRLIDDEIRANPLLRCGLVLAPDPPEEDGLLTAQEIVGHDLRALDWVVLSACNSGLGQLIPGEGLFGLRRAFEIAGARTVLMALWRISDATTQQLMTEIYRHRLAGHSTVEAVRQAELARLADQRQRHNRLHPAGWGGIVVEGDWR